MEADTPRIEEYLESIYKLQQEQHPVSTGRLAEHLKLSPPSVSEMVKKLAGKDLVQHIAETATPAVTAITTTGAAKTPGFGIVVSLVGLFTLFLLVRKRNK
jgi:PGF-CTERM protein